MATVLTGLGLRSQDHREKHKFYRFAVLCMGIARKYTELYELYFCNLLLLLLFICLVVCLLTALVIYPVCFATELNLGKFFSIVYRVHLFYNRHLFQDY